MREREKVKLKTHIKTSKHNELKSNHFHKYIKYKYIKKTEQ